MKISVLSVALVAVMMSSIGLLAATSSTHVDANGNALPANPQGIAEVARILKERIGSKS